MVAELAAEAGVAVGAHCGDVARVDGVPAVDVAGVGIVLDGIGTTQLGGIGVPQEIRSIGANR